MLLVQLASCLMVLNLTNFGHNWVSPSGKNTGMSAGSDRRAGSADPFLNLN